MKKLFDWFGGKNYFIAVAVLLLFAAFLRFYKLGEYVTFLGDQGRDAIIMKNIVTLKNFPAIGPITSVGSIYLGPFYYYLMAPWLGLFGLNPIGPAFGVAFISLVCIALQYLAVKDLTDKTTALISVVFSTFSWVLIEYSRYSWNPNLLAPVMFFVVYSLIKALRTNNIIWYILTGALLSALVQLHYLALFLVPFVGIVLLVKLVTDKKRKVHALTNIAVALISFFILYSPFVLFEIKHHFPNVTSAINFVKENSSNKNGEHRFSYINEFGDTSGHLYQYAFQIDLDTTAAFVIGIAYIAVLIAGYKYSKKKFAEENIIIITLAFLTLLFGTAIYHGPKLAHYLGGMYILLYVMTAYIFGSVIKKNRTAGLIIGLLFILAFIGINAEKYIFVWQKEGPNEIRHAQRIGLGIMSFNPSMPYSITSSPEAYADYPYRYFLEAWNKGPISKEQDSYVPTKELYVVCEKKCDPMADSQWAIAHFSAKKVSGEKMADGVYIYKLTK